MSQTETIISMMKRGWVTPLQATQRLGYCNFGARMTEIRKMIQRIDSLYLASETRVLKNGKRIKAHRLLEAK